MAFVKDETFSNVSRRTWWGIGSRMYLNVQQTVGLDTLNDDTMDKPRVHLFEEHISDMGIVKELSETLLDAIQLCNQWDADTGKPRGEVLK